LFFAIVQKVINGHFKLVAKFRHGFTMKTDDAAQAQNAANKDVVALIKLDASNVVFVGHGIHALAPDS